MTEFNTVYITGWVAIGTLGYLLLGIFFTACFLRRIKPTWSDRQIGISIIIWPITIISIPCVIIMYFCIGLAKGWMEED